MLKIKKLTWQVVVAVLENLLRHLTRNQVGIDIKCTSTRAINKRVYVFAFQLLKFHFSRQFKHFVFIRTTIYCHGLGNSNVRCQRFIAMAQFREILQSDKLGHQKCSSTITQTENSQQMKFNSASKQHRLARSQADWSLIWKRVGEIAAMMQKLKAPQKSTDYKFTFEFVM